MSSTIPTSPERRSDADLQRILDTLVGAKDTVLTGNLPELLSTYEQDHSIKILDESDFVGVKQICEQYPDLALGPTELFQFLMAALPAAAPSSPSPNPAALPSSRSMPPTSFKNADQQTPSQAVARRRRHSDRIRSPSDSSSSSSDDENITTRPRGERQTSAPPQSAHAFPSYGKAAPAPPGGWLPMRKKTISDPNSSDGSLNSPLAMRVRGAVGPSSYGGFARPSPASRRRRGSSGAAQQPFDDDRNNPEVQSAKPSFGRSTSTTSVARSVSRSSHRYDSRPTSPMSPMDGIDNTSFHERAESPGTEGADETELVEGDIGSERGQVEDDDIGAHDEEEVDMDVMGKGMLPDSLNPRLSRISTESTHSLRTSHDNLRKLRKENSELIRKLKETEKSLAVQGAENERLYEDLQARLEEAQAEINQRRKDEKEMKGKERAQLIQISGFEADISSLQRSLDNSKANHANMQKMYNSQCDEAQRLRDLLRDRDDEIRDFEEHAQVHAADENKLSQEIQALETEVKRLEADLAIARQAESHLEVQKQENLQLKETIDRMRFDLDEARAAAANATGSALQRGGTAASSEPQSLSRNLGDELNRRLMDVEKVAQESHAEGDEDSFIETIVTTQRTRKVGNRSQNAAAASSSAQRPVIRVEEGIREYTDAGTETDQVSEHTHDHDHLPPAYTAEPSPVNSAEVLEKAHPRSPAQEGPADDEYEVLVDSLGMRCTVFEEALELKRAERARKGPAGAPHPRTFWSDQRKHYRSSIVNYIVYNTDRSIRDQVGTLAMFTVAAFAIGLVAGSHIYGTPSGIHPRDLRLFQQMNTLVGAGVGEGFFPMSMLAVAERGARLMANDVRIPT